jgi:hypothetical protein
VEFRKKWVNVLGFFSKCPWLKNKNTPLIKSLWNPKIHLRARFKGPPPLRGVAPREREKKFKVFYRLRQKKDFEFFSLSRKLNFPLKIWIFFEKIVNFWKNFENFLKKYWQNQVFLSFASNLSEWMWVNQ